jgi:hypothetical protein
MDLRMDADSSTRLLWSVGRWGRRNRDCSTCGIALDTMYRAGYYGPFSHVRLISRFQVPIALDSMLPGVLDSQLPSAPDSNLPGTLHS